MMTGRNAFPEELRRLPVGEKLNAETSAK